MGSDRGCHGVFTDTGVQEEQGEAFRWRGSWQLSNPDEAVRRQRPPAAGDHSTQPEDQNTQIHAMRMSVLADYDVCPAQQGEWALQRSYTH